MGFLENILGIPSGKSISEEFNNVFSPSISSDMQESYDAAAKDVRTVGNSSMNETCPSCNKNGYLPGEKCGYCGYSKNKK
jgi:hypothetical protein